MNQQCLFYLIVSNGDVYFVPAGCWPAGTGVLFLVVWGMSLSHARGDAISAQLFGHSWENLTMHSYILISLLVSWECCSHGKTWQVHLLFILWAVFNV